MNLSDYLKLDIQSFYKSQGQLFGKRTSTNIKSQNLKIQRKDLRNKLVCEKRQINSDNISPYVTPYHPNKTINTNKPTNSKRYEMLLKWKEEKLKKQTELKAKAKPIFKVMHVSTDIGLPNLDNINKVIKGKPIKIDNKTKKKPPPVKSQFAPQSYQFKGPKNVVPIYTKVSTSQPKKVLTTHKESKVKNALPQRNLKKVTINKVNGFVTPKKQTKTYEKTPAIVRNLKRNGQKPNGKENVEINQNIKEYDLRNRKVAVCIHEKPKQLNKLIKTSGKSNVHLKEENANIINSNQVLFDENETRPVLNSRSSASPVYSFGECIDSSQNSTPKKETSCMESKTVIYISPFVTINRGKNSARKEFLSRKSQGGLDNRSPDLEIITGPKAGAAYFRRLLNQEISRIENLCNEWNLYKDEQHPPEEALDMINVAVGQSQLLIQKKFNQFRSLINSCENSDSVMPITCEDLHGYWDTAYIQVENLNTRFENLNKLRANNWEEILPVKKTVHLKKVAISKPKVQASSLLRDAIRAARDKKKAKANLDPDGEDAKVTRTSNSDFFPIVSPSTPVKSPGRTSTRKRKSLLMNVLTNQSRKRDSSPGLIMLKATQVAKSVEKECSMTPSKSILKTRPSKSNAKLGKSVLFKEECVNDVPVGKLISITDSDEETPRKSLRRTRGQKLF